MANTKSGLFLTELILSLLFFALAGTAYIQMFSKVHTLRINAKELNNAITITQNISDSFYSVNGDTDSFKALFPCFVNSDNSLVFYFDENGNSQDKDNASYNALLTSKDTEDNMIKATLNVYVKDRLIESTNLSCHIPLRRSE